MITRGPARSSSHRSRTHNAGNSYSMSPCHIDRKACLFEILYDIISLTMRYVLDTNVVVSGLRSPTGASAALIDRALSRAFTPLLSVALALEYEAICRDPAQRIVSGLSETEVSNIVSALCAVSEPVGTWFLWRPQLRDPSDEMVLEAAVNGNADALVTFNRRDFGDAPGYFGIALLSPQEALRRISS